MLIADAAQALYATRITTGWFPIVLLTTLGVGLLILIVTQAFRGLRRALGKELIVAVISGLVGGGITWFISNGIVLFGVELGWTVIILATIGFTIVGFEVATIIWAHGWRRILACVLIPLSLLGTAQQINAVYGEYQTIGSLVDYSPYAHIASADISLDTISVAQWKRQVAAGMQHPAAQGKLLSATIPNTQSHFRARKAMVWLPPAALAKHPPRLPVMVMLAGQPGSPTRYFEASATIAILTKYAQQHDGLAPIVVSPDQNTSASRNSLCADTTKVGKAETYLTQDVPHWIRTTLPVDTHADMWTIGGFSQGGTCSTQLGPNHPDLFGNVIAVDGELHPTDGSVDSMVANYFGGNQAAYERQVPVNAIANHAPSNQVMILAAGEKDHESMNNIATIGSAAQDAGWTVWMLKATDAGHDWHAVNQTLQATLPWLCDRMGLGSSSQMSFPESVTIHEKKIEVLQ